MDSQLQSISKIFTEKLYRIPDYQRGYAWTEKQLKDFWNDIMQLEENKNHYVGVLTLESVPEDSYKKWEDDKWIINSKSFEPYYIVDGQQRLTTTIILIQAVTEVIKKREELNYMSMDEIRKRYIFDSKDGGISRSYIFGYEKDNPSYEFLKTKIFLETSLEGYLSEETIYTHNLIFAKKFFIEKLKQLNKAAIQNVFKKISQHLLFNIYTITSDIDVFIAFETMNNRGKPLSNLELLKNRLIYLSTKFRVDENERSQLRKKINDAWKAVYHFLGKNKENPLNDDVFLMNHTLIYFGKDPVVRQGARRFRDLSYYSDNYENYLLEKKFSLKNIYSSDDNAAPVTVEVVNNYVESLQSSVVIWYNIFNPSLSNLTDDEEKRWLDKLTHVNMRNLSALILAAYQTKPTKTQKIKFLRTIERMAFIELFSAQHHPWSLRDFAVGLANNEMTVSEVLEELHMRTESAITSRDFIDEVTRRFNNIGYYNWSGSRYFLFEYENSLKENSRTKRTKINWEEFIQEKTDYITVEHISPQTATNECWLQHYNLFTPKQKKQLCNSLGNLLPLSKPKNSSLQNKCFLDKIDNDANQVGYRYGSYSENEISKKTDWQPQDILIRGIHLLTFLEKRWQISLGDETQKKKMLGLSFLT